MRLHRNYQDPFGIFGRYTLMIEGEGGDEGGKGGDGGGGGDEGGDDKDKDKGKPKSEAKDVNEIVEGRLRKEREATLKALGVETLDEAKEVLKKAKEAEEANLSATEKAKKDADEAKAASDKLKSEAAQDRHEAKVERKLLRELAKLELDDEAEGKRVARLQRLIDVEVGASDEDIATAITTLKEEWPELFGESAKSEGEGGNGDGKPKGKESDPKGGPPKKKQGEKTAMERGAERARQAIGARQGYAFEKQS